VWCSAGSASHHPLCAVLVRGGYREVLKLGKGVSVPLPVPVDIFHMAEEEVVVSDCALLCTCSLLLKRFCRTWTVKSGGTDVTVFKTF